MRNSATPSTRQQTKQSGVFVRSTGGSQSLERGMRLLRAFIGGVTDLTNAELAERCGLPRPTVSRLTRSLVDGGFLEFDANQSVYRLAPVFLSLGSSYHQSHTELASVLPLLRETAKREAINISLLVRDGMHMVYVASFRAGRGPVQRVVNVGSRLPIEKYVSGHAMIAAMPPVARARLLDQLADMHGAEWSTLNQHIQQSILQHRRLGYCAFESVPGLTAVSNTLRASDGTQVAVVLTSAASETSGDPYEKLIKVIQVLCLEIMQVWIKRLAAN